MKGRLRVWTCSIFKNISVKTWKSFKNREFFFIFGRIFSQNLLILIGSRKIISLTSWDFRLNVNKGFASARGSGRSDVLSRPPSLWICAPCCRDSETPCPPDPPATGHQSPWHRWGFWSDVVLVCGGTSSADLQGTASPDRAWHSAPLPSFRCERASPPIPRTQNLRRYSIAPSMPYASGPVPPPLDSWVLPWCGIVLVLEKRQESLAAKRPAMFFE